VVKAEWRKTQHMYALMDYEDDEARLRGSIGRIRHILGKLLNVFNMLESLSQRVLKRIARYHYPLMARSLRGILI